MSYWISLNCFVHLHLNIFSFFNLQLPHYPALIQLFYLPVQRGKYQVYSDQHPLLANYMLLQPPELWYVYLCFDLLSPLCQLGDQLHFYFLYKYLLHWFQALFISSLFFPFTIITVNYKINKRIKFRYITDCKKAMYVITTLKQIEYWIWNPGSPLSGVPSQWVS